MRAFGRGECRSLLCQPSLELAALHLPSIRNFAYTVEAECANRAVSAPILHCRPRPRFWPRPRAAPHSGPVESMKMRERGGAFARLPAGDHPALIHFSLEFCGRVSASSCMVWVAGNRLFGRIFLWQASHGVLTDSARESFPNYCRLFDAAQKGFCFHPSDQDLSPGTPEERATCHRQTPAAARGKFALTQIFRLIRE